MTGTDDTLILLAAGDTVYVFDDQEKAGMHYHVCVGANLDVRTWRIASQRWDDVREGLNAGRNGIHIVDARTVAEPVAQPDV